jgi:hypothetical protein
MCLCNAAGSTSVPRQLRRLYKIPKASHKFEPAFDRFHCSVKYEEITDNLNDAELGDFIGFLDEVRSPSHYLGHHLDWSIRCCGLKTCARSFSRKSYAVCGASAANGKCSPDPTWSLMGFRGQAKRNSPRGVLPTYGRGSSWRGTRIQGACVSKQ